MVHLFDELVKTIPSSARLTGLKQTGQSMTLDGVAQSNASVAEYMRNIQASPWMGHADLRKTEKITGSGRMPYKFGLNVKLNRPKSDETTKSSGVASPAAMASPAVAGSTARSMDAMPVKPVAKPTSSKAGAIQPKVKGGAR
jgi:type IV pilus assembly protein PilN